MYVIISIYPPNVLDGPFNGDNNDVEDISRPSGWVQMSSQAVFHDAAVADAPQAPVLHGAERHQNSLQVLVGHKAGLL